MTPLDAFAKIVGSAVPLRQVETVDLSWAAGRIAAAPVHAPAAVPRFDHSAVDGYGIPDDGHSGGFPRRFELAASVAAGSAAPPPLLSGQAVKLATGAPVPAGVAAVVMQEHCRVAGAEIVVEGGIAAYANIRRRGEDVAMGALLVRQGTMLDSRHIGLLAATGVARIEVMRPLRVAILSTGNELQPLGASAAAHQIYDANRPMLAALLRLPWIELIDTGIVGDTTALLAAAFRGLVGRADAVISSGGVGGSQTDHVAAALVAAGGTAHPLRVAQRPGKPLVSGAIGDMAVLGLPGNTVAALINLHLYGLPMLMARAGASPAWPAGQVATTRHAIAHAAGRTDFAPAMLVGRTDSGHPVVERLGQAANGLLSLATANGLMEIDGGHGDVAAGEAVIFHPFRTRFQP